jgi:hypothetical protein
VCYSAFFACTAVELDVLARLNNSVLVKFIFATISNGVVGDSPDLSELLTNVTNGLASNVAWLIASLASVCAFWLATDPASLLCWNLIAFLIFSVTDASNCE